MIAGMRIGSTRTLSSMSLMRALFAVVALMSQIVIGSLVLPDDSTSDAASIRAVAELCGSGSAGHPHRHRNEGRTCSLDIALELPAVILTDAPASLPPARLATAIEAIWPSPRAPPSLFVLARHARGPPALA